VTPERQLELIKQHVAGQHPMLDCEDCPVCIFTLAQHGQSEEPS
jgi:hypothetical protein